MGVDAGFDMVPRLSRGAIDRQNWDQFISFIKDYYKDDVQVEVHRNYLEFKAGEHPRLPFEGHKFLRFSSKIIGDVEDYLDFVRSVARVRFGFRIQAWHERADQFGHYNWHEVHESIRSYEQPDEPNIPGSIAEGLNGTSPITELGIPLFEIQDIPTKGRGLVARFQIPVGTRILCEKPLITVQHMSPNELELILATKLKTLSKAEQRKFLSLHNNSPGKYPFGSIVRTNALPCGSSSNVGGIYPTICLINHSCLPNSHNSWNSTAEHETIHAIRPIKAGEEVTISYDRGGPSAVRKALLKTAFGFDCECTGCTLPPSEIQASDTRRLRIQDLDANIGDPYRMRSSPEKSLGDCHSLLHILQEEYDGWAGVFTPRLYYDAFQISVAHGDLARASIFAEKVYKAKVICEGEDSPATQRGKSLALNPTDHGNFGAYSMKWKTTREMISTGLDAAEFEKWLFRQ